MSADQRANKSACVRVPPCAPADPGYGGPVQFHRELETVEDSGFNGSPPYSGVWPWPADRAAHFDIAWLARPFGAWSVDEFTGVHGVIRPRELVSQQKAGGMGPWDEQRRTLRSAPVVAWDAGTALGAGE